MNQFAAKAVFENWNRYYDPNTGRYLSPEPLLQNPSKVVKFAKDGFGLPAYAYANDNPVGFVDENGEEYKNRAGCSDARFEELKRNYESLNPGVCALCKIAISGELSTCEVWGKGRHESWESPSDCNCYSRLAATWCPAANNRPECKDPRPAVCEQSSPGPRTPSPGPIPFSPQ